MYVALKSYVLFCGDELTGGRASSSCSHRVDIFPNGVSYDGCIYGVMGLCGFDYKTCMKGS